MWDMVIGQPQETSEAFVQYVVGPFVVAILAGIGWLIRTYLKAIRHQVENDHGTNLRADVDRILLSVEKHEENDRLIAGMIARIELVTNETSRGLIRLEDRFDRHIDKTEGG